MPTYEYACPHCGIFEVFQSITEAALTKCPKCKKRKVARMMSGGAGVIFKGSGFWETDYNRSADYQKKTKAESGEPPAQSKTQTEPKKADCPAGGGATAPATPAAPAKEGKSPAKPPAKPPKQGG